MLKKKSIAVFLVTCILLTASVAVPATETDWLLMMRASTSGYTSAGPIGQFGTAPGASDGPGPEDVPLDQVNNSVAYVASFQPTAPVPMPLYQTDKKASILPGDAKVWDLLLWAGTDYTGSDLRLAWWGVSAKAAPPYIGYMPVLYQIEVIQDPTGQHQGQVIYYGIDGIPTGTSTNPAGYIQWTSFPKIDAANSLDSAVRLRFTAGPVPEPSSMFALASGLSGMAAFMWRKKK